MDDTTNMGGVSGGQNAFKNQKADPMRGTERSNGGAGEDTKKTGADIAGESSAPSAGGGMPPITSPPSKINATPRGEEAIKGDIQKILSEVKLPARRSSDAGGPKREKPAEKSRGLTFDTQAASMISDADLGIKTGGDVAPMPQDTPISSAPLPKKENTPYTTSHPPTSRPQLSRDISPTIKKPAFSDTSTPLPTAPITKSTASLQPKLPSRVLAPKQTEEPIQKVIVPPSREEAKASAQAPKAGGAIPSLRTLKEDLQDIVREKNVSLVRAVALEEEKKHKRDEAVASTPVHSHRSQKTLLIALLFLVLGLLALGGVYMVVQSQAARSEPLLSSIIFSEQTISFNIGKQPFGEVKRNLSALRSFTQLTLGAITRVVPTMVGVTDGITEERPATLTEFFNSLGVPAPSDLTRALGDDFFFGIHVVDENAPVIVVPVVSYERAFAAMLAWEKDINSNLSPIFTPVSPFILDENGLLAQRPFEDLVIRNYDVRALRDDAGMIQLYYSFPTRNILIIAESTYSFTEILSRLRAERRL